MKKRFAVLSPPIFCLLVIVVSLFGSVYLAVPKTSALTTVDLTALASSGSACGPLKILQPQFDACIAGYIGARQGKTEAEACPPGSTEVNSCKAGFTFGTNANKAPGAAPATAADGPLTTAEAKTLAATDAACGPLKILKAQFDACVAGYVAARQGKTEAQACPPGSAEINSCKAGFKFGTDAAAAAAAAASATPTGGATDPNAQELSCDAGFNPLNWLICAAIKGMVAVLNGVDGVINNLLSVGTPNEKISGDPTDIFDTSNDTGKAYHTAWASFRNIALGLLLIAGLIMVMTQALGWELLDAYTIRKVLPRLLFSAVAISVSWPGLHFIVQLFNDLGYGVRNLIQAPFATTALAANTVKIGGGQGAATFLATAVAFQALGVFGLLTFVATALLAAFIAFIVLIIRQIVVVVLVMIAPIALVLYILPNTNKYWKIWMDSLGGALLMFPIISALIAAGRVFSAVANQGGGPGGDTLGSFIAFAAYFAPYFLIPATFKFAGGAVRTIGGAVGDRGKGLSGRIQKARQDKTADRIKRARSGGIYDKDFIPLGKSGKYSVGKALNLFGAYTLDADEQVGAKLGQAGAPLLGRYARQKFGEIDDARIEHNAKLAQKLGGDYRLGWALGSRLEHFSSVGKQVQDEDGNWSFQGGNEDVRNQLIEAGLGSVGEDGKVTWKAAQTGTQLKQLGDILGTDPTDKDAQTASSLIASNFHLLETKDRYDDTRRADWQSTGLMMAAGKGKLDGHELAETLTEGAVNDESFAMKREQVLENASQQQRPELRLGHAVRVNRETTADGKPGRLIAASIQPPTTGRSLEDVVAALEAGPAHERAAAESAVSGITGSQLMNARAETVRDAAPVLILQAGGIGNTTPIHQRSQFEQQRIMELQQGAQSPYSSQDQKDEFIKILRTLKLPEAPPSAIADPTKTPPPAHFAAPTPPPAATPSAPAPPPPK